MGEGRGQQKHFASQRLQQEVSQQQRRVRKRDGGLGGGALTDIFTPYSILSRRSNEDIQIDR